MTNGIFGQVPQNGEYIVGSAARKPIMGVGQIAQSSVYVEPPYYDDGGILRIDPGSASTFKWSMNVTTTLEGADVGPVDGYAATTLLEVPSVTFGRTGDYWLDQALAMGQVVLFRGKPATQLSGTLTFITTMDPAAIKAFASAEANNFIVIDGPEPLISLAKGVAPTPGGTPALPPPPELPPPTTPMLPPMPSLPSSSFVPTTTAAAPEEPPTWLLPALVGVGAVSVFVILSNKKKRG